MSRTQSPRITALMKEANAALGIDRTYDVFKALRPITAALDELQAGAVLSPYRNSNWGVTWITPTNNLKWVKVDPKDFSLSGADFISKYISL